MFACFVYFSPGIGAGLCWCAHLVGYSVGDPVDHHPPLHQLLQAAQCEFDLDSSATELTASSSFSQALTRTLSVAFPELLKFLLCTSILFIAFSLCGYIVFSPYTSRVSLWSYHAPCVSLYSSFSLLPYIPPFLPRIFDFIHVVQDHIQFF